MQTHLMQFQESSLQRLFTNVARRMQCTSPTEAPECSGRPCTLIRPQNQLQTTRLSPTIGRQLSDACLKAAQELFDMTATEGTVRTPMQATREVMDNPVHTEETRAWAEDAVSYVLWTVANANLATTGPLMKGKKAVFNHEYTPLLEKYFEINAYPSSADRMVLARKSMMTPRQIEVWFQNHRNRARKDGKLLRKSSGDPIPLEISLKTLESKMPFFIIPEHERKPIKKSEPPKDEADMPTTPKSLWNPSSADVLNPPGPVHAFPMVYPPRCGYDPFPTKTGTYKFPSPTWYRTAATPRRTPKVSVNINEFIEDFEMKLHLRVPAIKQMGSKTTRSWYAGRVTVPLAAPLHALVRCPLTLTSRHMPRLSAVPAPLSRLHPFKYPDPCSQPTTSISPRHPCETSIRREYAGLPKRKPKNTSIAHRHGPAISEASPPPSRSSSLFSSDSSLDRRPSTSSSSSSSSSSALTTPVLSLFELSEDAHSPSVSLSGVDSDREPLSLAEGIPPNLSMPTQPKRPFASRSFEVTQESIPRCNRSPSRSRASQSDCPLSL
ncbi:hypothetical protein D9615_001301 [Tricholomella constricta]|uniref:Homeobox domain-containing protein n=1 Tax=Tricholomella constricta TaxID=117010 RepID=A0A8H5M8Q0_9AGAR|nr:hypothetical protein D9615_001301 [Tricholomella constricta]